MSHLGANPDRGGRPPKERRIRGERAATTGVFVQEVARVFTFVVLLSLNIMKAEEVIMR